jgi:hypothetical protein
MTRKLKALGLALFALCALGAMTAGSASAAGELFRSEKETTILTGTNVGNHVFETPAGLKITCEVATFNGTAKAETVGGTTTKTLTVHPTYEKCKDSLFNAAAPVDTTGCNYVFTSETKENATKEKHLPASIECTSGFAIKVTASGCTLTFGAQATTNGIVVTNEGKLNERDIKAKATAGAAFTKDAPATGSTCGFITGTTGTYTGEVTLKGFVDNGVTGPIDEVEGAAPGTDKTAVYTEGAQVGIWWE